MTYDRFLKKLKKARVDRLAIRGRLIETLGLKDLEWDTAGKS